MLTDTVQELTRKDYDRFRDLIYRQCGINLGEQKMQLVRARLGKRLRAGQFKSYGQYFEFVKNDNTGQELTRLIDAISTNTTHLFREKRHFEFLSSVLKRWVTAEGGKKRTMIRIWSAGCSSGEEPYSVAMTVDDEMRDFPGVQVKILATDISTRMLDRAKEGVFTPERLASVPPEFKRRYFTPVKQDGEKRLCVSPALRKMITFGRLNFMDDQFPFRNRFDVIFCRNVMIYFDRPTQERLVAKFAGVLSPGGYLMIGHSESLNNITHPLKYVVPTVYLKA